MKNLIHIEVCILPRSPGHMSSYLVSGRGCDQVSHIRLHTFSTHILGSTSQVLLFFSSRQQIAPLPLAIGPEKRRSERKTRTAMRCILGSATTSQSG